MNRFIILTRVMIKNFNLFGMISAKSGKNRIKNIALSLLVVIALLPTVFGIGTLAFGGHRVLSEIRQEGLILGMGFSISSLTIFFFGIFYAMSIFYFSKDIDYLLPLPLRASEILAAKFTVSLIYEYLTESIFLAPILIGFGIAGKAGLTYYLYSLVLFLALPVIPLIYATMISMLIMGFTGLAKNKDRFRIIGGIAAIILAVGLNAYVTKLGSSGMSAEELQQLLAQGDNSFVSTISGIFFSNRFAVTALLHTSSLRGFINLAVFLLISLLFIMLFLGVGESIYYKGAVGVSEAPSKRKKYSEKELKGFRRQKSVLGAYTIKELKLLFRTPVYFMNCVLTSLLFPLFILMPFIFQPDEAKELQSLSVLISDTGNQGIVLAATFAMSVMVTSVNSIASSAISREGTNIYICKYLPVSYRIQIMAKALSGAFIGAIGTLSMVLTAAAFVRLPLSLIILIVPVTALGIIFSSFTGIFIDLSFPKLVWDNEQKAVKQNFNVVLNMLVSLIIAGIPVFVAIALKFMLWMTFAALAVVFGALDLLLYNLLSVIGARLFEKIEI